MFRSSLYGLAAALALTTGIYGCKKVNGIDNNQVIQTPYALFFADSAGAVYNSNDGSTKKLLFSADGKLVRALTVAGNNIFVIKDNLYYSTNNGGAFNRSYDSVSQERLRTCSGELLPLNQTMVLYLPDPEPSWVRTYVASNDPTGLTSTIVTAAFTGPTHGTRGSYQLSKGDTMDNIGSFPVGPTSFTKLANNLVVGYDATRDRVLYISKEYPFWRESTGNDAGRTGVGAPPRQTGTGLPDTAYCIGHLNNRLIALINDCPSHGAWYSDDTGRNWTSYPGLPQNTLMCIAAPFEQVCLVGTKGAGLYVLNLNTGVFQRNTNGLAGDLHVRSITAKEEIYKNGTTQRYIYLATNKGIFRSRDGGLNWTMTAQGNFVAIY